MPLTTPVRELQAEDKSESAPRRSSRIAQNSPAPSAVVQRRNSASNNDTPAKITRAKRLSLSQENGTDLIEAKQSSEANNPDIPKRTRLTRSASKSPTALSKVTETKPAPVKARGRRGSQTKTAEEENVLDSPAPRNTRRRSARSESASPTSVKEAEPAKPKTRRGSITDKINQLEKIDEVGQTTVEPKKRVKGRRSSLTEMSQLDVIEETESGKNEKEKKIELESITEAEEKNIPSTSSATESKSNEKSIADNKIDKLNLSAVVKIEKTKTITSLTTNSDPMAKTTTVVNDNKRNNHEDPSSEANSNVATSCASPIKLSTAKVSVENDMEIDGKATSSNEATSCASPIKLSTAKVSVENNLNVVEKATDSNETTSCASPDKRSTAEVSSKQDMEIDRKSTASSEAASCASPIKLSPPKVSVGNDMEIDGKATDSNEVTSSAGPIKLSTAKVSVENDMNIVEKATEQTSIDKIEEELEILLNKNENQDSGTPEPLNALEKQNKNEAETLKTNCSTASIDKSKECENEKTPNLLLEEKSLETGLLKSATSVVLSTTVCLEDTPPMSSSESKSLNDQVDSLPQVNISDVNETKIVNKEDANTVKLSAEQNEETSNDIIGNSRLTSAEEPTKDSVPQQSDNNQTTRKEGFKEQSETSELSKQDEKTVDVLPNCDNKDSSQSTPSKDFHNKSLENLLPEQLEMTTSSEGSFHISLSTENAYSHLVETPKKEASNAESDILNKSDSSDKENTATPNKITEDVTKTKSPSIEKTPLTDKSSNRNNRNTKSPDDSCEPMDVDDPPLSYMDITENIKTQSQHAKKRSSTPNKKSQSSVEFSDAFVNESLNCIDDSKIEEHQKDEASIDNDAINERNILVASKIDNSENADVQGLTEKDVAGTTNNEKLENNIVVDEQAKENDNIGSRDEDLKWKEDGYSSPVFSIDSNDESDEENISVSSDDKRQKQHEKVQGSTFTSEKEQIIRETDSTIEVSKLDVTVSACEKSIGKNAVTADESIEIIKKISKENVAELNSTPSKNLTPQDDPNMRNLTTRSPFAPSKDKEDIVIEISSSPTEKGDSTPVEKKRASFKKIEAESDGKSKSPSKKLNLMEFTIHNENEDDISKNQTKRATKSTPTKKKSPKRSNDKSPKLLKQNITATNKDADLYSSRDIETGALNTSPQPKKKLSVVQLNVEEKHKGERRKSSEIGSTKEKSPRKKAAKIVPIERGDDVEIRDEIAKLINDTVEGLTSNSEDENKSNSDNENKSNTEDEEEEKAEVNEFIDEMAEEGEEDTPSEGSNDISYEGESINSSDTFTDDDDESYEDDSFIDDEHDKYDLLSGEEDFLQGEVSEKKSARKNKPAASKKIGKKHKRILEPSSSEGEEDNQVAEKNILNGNSDEAQDSKQTEKPNQEESCRNENTEVERVLEEVEKIMSTTNNEVRGATVTSPTFSEELLPSTNDVIDLDSSSDSASVNSVKEENKTEEDANTTLSDKKSKRTSSITIQENIKLEDIQDGELSSRISKVVDWFYSGIKGSGDTGNISLNVSLDYADQTNEEKVDDEELKSVSDTKKSSKRKSKELKINKSSENIAPEEYEDDVFIKNFEETQERDKLKTSPKKSRRKSVKQQIEKECTDDEKLKVGSKRLSDENIESVSPKKNKYDFDFVIEDLVTINDKKKKKAKKSKNKDDDEILEAIKNQEPTTKDGGNVSKKHKRKYLEMMNIPELLKRDNEKPNDNKIKKKKRIPLSDEEYIDNTESMKKIDKLGSLKKKKSNLNEFNVEFDDAKKSKKLIYTTEKADHIPCSSGILKKYVSADTHVSKYEINETKQTAVKLRRKISRKLLPTKGTDLNDSWESEVFDRTLRPSKSNKKMEDMKAASRKTKTEIDSFNSKDFKNKMLYDSNRIKRMDTKALLRRKKM